MQDKRHYLAVKITSLAQEARIIRKRERHSGRILSYLEWLGKRDPEKYTEERWQKWRQGRNSDLREGFTHHRLHVVRPEARDSQLAYAFLRGKAFAKVEPTARTIPNWANVHGIVDRFGPVIGRNKVAENFKLWIADAMVIISTNHEAWVARHNEYLRRRAAAKEAAKVS